MRRTGTATSSVGNNDRPPAAEAVHIRPILVRFAVVLVLLTALLGVLGAFFHEPIVRAAGRFVSLFGGWGVLAGFFLTDAFPVPVPPDVFSAAGLLGGLGCPGSTACGARGFWITVAWASTGSLVGSTLGFAIGRAASRTTWFRRVIARRGDVVTVLVERYGVWALVIGAVTPVNYCLTAWATGAGKLPWSRFFAVAWLRIPRVALYLWLMRLGFVNPMS